MVEQKVTFKNRVYRFERTIPTLISDQYVPDWTLSKAVKESVQNMMDERTATGCNAKWKYGADNAYFYDAGRGVDVEQIFIIGDSGKRGQSDMVGQHGEGEVVSFMVATREGVSKTMASQDWLARGRFEDMAGRMVLVIDLYRSKGKRNGTAWEYTGAGVEQAMTQSLRDFRVKIREAQEEAKWQRKHARQRAAQRNRKRQARAKKRILLNEPAGYMFTNGAYVGHIEGLALAYNLEATPGRDRAAFAWEQVKGEIQHILSTEATKYHIERIFKRAMRYGADQTREMSLDLQIDPDTVKRAIRRATGSRSLKKLAWADYGHDASFITDATGQGIQVIGFHGQPPTWVSDAMHTARSLSGVTSKRVERVSPKSLLEATELAIELLTGESAEDAGVEVLSVHKLKDDPNATAYASGYKLVLVKTQMKGLSATAFLRIITHELGHIVYGYPDCTREHEQATGTMLSEALERVATDANARRIFKRMSAKFARYAKV